MELVKLMKIKLIYACGTFSDILKEISEVKMTDEI